MDARIQFYLDHGWKTARMARIAGMYEDGESIREELEHLDMLLDKIKPPALKSWAALYHDCQDSPVLNDIQEWSKTFRQEFTQFCSRHHISDRTRDVIVRQSVVWSDTNDTLITRTFGYRPTLADFMNEPLKMLLLRNVGAKTVKVLRDAWAKDLKLDTGK